MFSVEWDKDFENIDLYEDILKVTAQDIIEKFGHPDVIWASPDCFPAGTLIWTDKGYKKIEDIECKDRVLAHTGKYQRVYNTWKTNKYDVYEVKIAGCEPQLVTSEHPYLARKKNRVNTHKNGEVVCYSYLSNPEWVKVCDLSNEYRVGIRVNQESVIPAWDGTIYETKNGYGITRTELRNELSSLMSNHDFWWLVGRYFGDGSLSKDKGTVCICCAKDEDEEILEHLNNLPLNYKYREVATANQFNFHNKELCCFLERYGVGAANKSITSEILNLPIELLRSFLDGYISADGHWDFSLQNPNCSITTISKELAYGFQLCILKAYGVYGSMVVRKNNSDTILGRKVNCKKAYCVSFYKNKTNLMHYSIEDGVCWVNVSYAKKLPSKQTTVYNFSVENDESYTANNIIVHNCTTFSVAAISKHRRKNPETGSLDPISDYAKFCDKVDCHVLDLIRELKPKYYFIENPRGAMRKMSWMQGLPRYTVTYCKYGEKRMKPTDIWTNHPDPKFIPACRNGDP